MRLGRVFRRCSRCGSRASERQCSRCGHDAYSWTFAVDVAPPGAPREQRTKGGFATKSAALSAMSKLQVSKATGTFVEPQRLTVGAYLDSWLASRSGQLRGNTARDYETSIRRHIGPRLGSVPLQGLTRVQVKGLYQGLAEAGLGEKTVHNVHVCLRKALADAVEDRLLQVNPADRAHQRPKDRPEVVTWTVEELRAFLAYVAADPDSALYRLAAMSGLRRGELLGLRWRDVDLDAGQLQVRQQWTRARQGLAFGPPKSRRGMRTVELDGTTVEALSQHRRAQEFKRRSWAEAYRSDLDLVFCRPDGSPHDPNVIGRRFNARVRDLGGVRRLRGLHDLRHTHATLLLENAEYLGYVSERLGHDSVQTTAELYGHVTARMRGNAPGRLAALVDAAEESVSIL